MNRKFAAAAIALAIIGASGFGLYKWMNNDEAPTPSSGDPPAVSVPSASEAEG